jgi:cyclase
VIPRITWLLAYASLLGAQVDLTGTWTPKFHEDQQDRIPGPDLGDYLGLPINEAARFSALTWSASRLTLPEHQCRVHISPYIYRGPLTFRSWEEKDPQTQQVVAIKNYISTYEQLRTIWMDNRPHPSPDALHTWMGFSTGKWEGDMLTVATTHLKEGWIRKNGIAESDAATLIEHFIRHGNYLTHVSIITDPVYLTEPMIHTEDFVLENNYEGSWLFPCETVVEVANRAKDDVPAYLPGENKFITEFTSRWGISEKAAMGGAETMYPEYRQNHSTKTTPLHPPPTPVSQISEIHVLSVQGNIYMLTSPDGANVTVQAGKQGVLLVDTTTAKNAPRILETLGKLSEGKIRYIINTGGSPDHIGGNEILRKAGITVVDVGAPGALNIVDLNVGAALIAHGNVLKRMSAPTGVQPPVPSGAWPTDTFFEDEKSVYFNDEAVTMIHQPAANTDGDVMVFFRRSDVISTGDIFMTDRYPVIDPARGGSIQGLIEALNRIVNLAVPAHEEEGGTLIIPGHGRLCDRSDVVLYRDMVAIVRDRIRHMIAKGMTLDQIKAARPTLDYDPRYGNDVSNVSAFIEAAYASNRR